MYAGNTYFWRRYRINYPFLFGFRPGTELDHRDVFLLTTGHAVIAVLCFLINLHLEMNLQNSHWTCSSDLSYCKMLSLEFNQLVDYLMHSFRKYLTNSQFIKLSVSCAACCLYHLLSFQHYIPVESNLLYPVFISLHMCSFFSGNETNTRNLNNMIKSTRCSLKMSFLCRLHFQISSWLISSLARSYALINFLWDNIKINIWHCDTLHSWFSCFDFSSKPSGVLCFTYAIMVWEKTQGGKRNVEVTVSITYNISSLASFLIGFDWRRFIQSFLLLVLCLDSDPVRSIESCIQRIRTVQTWSRGLHF